MRTERAVSAELDLLAERKKHHPELGKFLDFLDRVVGTEATDEEAKPLNRPYSGQELEPIDKWK